MRARRLGVAPLVILIAGCGASTPQVPDLARLPLVGGASVVARAQQCDRGTGNYCALQLVVVDPHFRNSVDLLKSEQRHLNRLGWSLASGNTGTEHSADSPGHKLRVTYATADGDLRGIVLGWIDRPRPIALALSRTLFARSPAISMMLELGSG